MGGFLARYRGLLIGALVGLLLSIAISVGLATFVVGTDRPDNELVGVVIGGALGYLGVQIGGKVGATFDGEEI